MQIPPAHFGSTPVISLSMSWRPSKADLEKLQHFFVNASWTPVQGSFGDRYFVLGMHYNDGPFHRHAEKMLENVRTMLLMLHPRHNCFAIGALKSVPRAKQQKWHTDYDLSIPLHSMPYSVLITFEDGCMFVYRDQMGKKQSVIVPPFSFVRFMGYVVHCGGANDTDKTIYRLFMYVSCNLASIPINSFYWRK